MQFSDVEVAQFDILLDGIGDPEFLGIMGREPLQEP